MGRFSGGPSFANPQARPRIIVTRPPDWRGQTPVFHFRLRKHHYGGDCTRCEDERVATGEALWQQRRIAGGSLRTRMGQSAAADGDLANHLQSAEATQSAHAHGSAALY